MTNYLLIFILLLAIVIINMFTRNPIVEGHGGGGGGHGGGLGGHGGGGWRGRGLGLGALGAYGLTRGYYGGYGGGYNDYYPYFYSDYYPAYYDENILYDAYGNPVIVQPTVV